MGFAAGPSQALIDLYNFPPRLQAYLYGFFDLYNVAWNLPCPPARPLSPRRSHR